MKLLITNDDGINSKAMMRLADFMAESGHEVTVVAPEVEMSAVSHAITMHDPIRVKKLPSKSSCNCYSTNGTPADCVKIALEVIMERKPDWIISGINKGLNLGSDIFYSGTLSAAMEGWFHGIPSFALSSPVNSHANTCFINEFFNNSIFNPLIEAQYKGLFNINFPNSTDFNEIRITELGTLKYVNIYNERIDPRGNTYYWLSGEISDQVKNNVSTDIHAVQNGFVSLTPINTDMTDYKRISELKRYFG
ncbi:MAG TPA: 5'/3'-nucleotidase SurE [Clostridia bacterium]|nr:5'/3'-nucleotidase SurE [Clostridia bacterium]